MIKIINYCNKKSHYVNMLLHMLLKIRMLCILHEYDFVVSKYEKSSLFSRQQEHDDDLSCIITNAGGWTQ